MNSLKSISLYVIFVLTAFISAYFFQLGDEIILALLPGPIFIATLLLMFALHGIRLHFEKVFYFFVADLAAYIILFFITASSGVFCAIIGPLIFGIGSLLNCYLIKKFIKDIKYDRLKTFLIGAASFALNLIILIEPIRKNIEIFSMNDEIQKMFAPSIFFWQAVVGISLSIKLKKG